MGFWSEEGFSEGFLEEVLRRDFREGTQAETHLFKSATPCACALTISATLGPATFECQKDSRTCPAPRATMPDWAYQMCAVEPLRCIPGATFGICFHLRAYNTARGEIIANITRKHFDSVNPIMLLPDILERPQNVQLKLV